MKKLKALTAIMLGGLALASCVNEQNHSNVAVMTGTYTFTGMVSDSTTGITANVTSSQIEWICPSGYTIPTVFVNNLPSFNQQVTATCNRQGGCETRYLWFFWDAGSSAWNINGSNNPVNQSETRQISNSDTDESGVDPDIFCVPISQKNDWAL